MLDDLALFEPHDVDHSFALFSWRADPFTVQDDKISVRKNSLDMQSSFWKVCANPIDEFGQPFPAVLDQRVVLPVTLAAIKGDGGRGIKVIDRLLEVSDCGILVLF